MGAGGRDRDRGEGAGGGDRDRARDSVFRLISLRVHTCGEREREKERERERGAGGGETERKTLSSCVSSRNTTASATFANLTVSVPRGSRDSSSDRAATAPETVTEKHRKRQRERQRESQRERQTERESMKVRLRNLSLFTAALQASERLVSPTHEHFGHGHLPSAHGVDQQRLSQHSVMLSQVPLLLPPSPLSAE